LDWRDDCGRTAGLAAAAVREPSSVVWCMWKNEVQASTPKSAGVDSPPPAGDKHAAPESLGVRILVSPAEKDGSIIRPGAACAGSRSCVPRCRGWTAWTGWTGPGQRANGKLVGLPATICLSIDRNAIPWDGVLANIPDWAQRLYANTPESERPVGWRARLVYSGEIFRFHFPEALDESNGIPTAEAMHWALLAGDHARVFPEVGATAGVSTASPRATDRKSDPQEALEKDGDLLALYAIAITRDLPRAKSVLQNVCISVSIRATTEAELLVGSRGKPFMALCGRLEAQCSARDPKAVLNVLGSWTSAWESCSSKSQASDNNVVILGNQINFPNRTTSEKQCLPMRKLLYSKVHGRNHACCPPALTYEPSKNTQENAQLKGDCDAETNCAKRDVACRYCLSYFCGSFVGWSDGRAFNSCHS